MTEESQQAFPDLPPLAQRVGVVAAPRSPGDWLALVLVALALMGAALLLFALTRFEYGLDQGIYAVVGDVMLAGGAPYRDAWDFKPPGVYFMYAVARAVFGDGMFAVRVLEALMWTSLIAAFGLLGRRFAGGFAPGLLAGALATSSYIWLGFWHTGQPEGFGAVLLVWGLCFATREVDGGISAPRLRASWAVAGALYTAAALMKPPLGGAFVVSLAFALVALRRRGTSAQTPFAVIACFSGGALVVLSGLGLYLAAKGALPDFYQALFVYTPEYTRRTYAEGDLASFSVRAVKLFLGRFSWLHPIGLALFVVLPRLASREREFALHVSAIFGLLLLGVALQGQFFAYHYAAAIPMIAWFAGIGFWKLMQLGGRFAVGGVVAAGLVFFFANANGLKGPIEGGFASRAQTLETGRHYNIPQRRVAAWVSTHTQPGEPIYIWGFQPMIHVLANRPPANRFLYNSPQRAVWSRDAARPELMEALTQMPPAAILVESGDPQLASTGNRLDSVAELAGFPSLAKFLAENYDAGTSIGAFKIHLRIDRVPAQPSRELP